jgi:hypothetical protein
MEIDGCIWICFLLKSLFAYFLKIDKSTIVTVFKALGSATWAFGSV